MGRYLRLILKGGIILGVAMVILVGFMLHYRLKESLQVLIKRESRGKLELEVGQATVDLLHGVLRLTNLRLYTSRPEGAELSCDIRIPDAYLALRSWRPVIASHEIAIDSIAIDAPQIRLRLSSREQVVAGRDTNLYLAWKRILSTTLHHLSIRTFFLAEGTIIVDGSAASKIAARDLNITFSCPDRAAAGMKHSCEADRIRFSMSSIRGNGPDRRQRFTISRLQLDCRGGKIEADSVDFLQEAYPGEDPYHFAAARCVLEMPDPTAVFRRGSLVIDSCICIDPIWHERFGRRTDRASADKGRGLTIVVKYLGVVNGSVMLHAGSGRISGVSSRKAGFKIYGLVVDGRSAGTFHTDSIRLSLDRLKFDTENERYSLTIGKMAIDREDAVFHDVRYGPVFDEADGSVNFSAPLLLLHKVDLDELLRGRLRASGVRLVSPRFDMVQKGNHGKTRFPAAPGPDSDNADIIYQTLHNFNELFHAGYLDVTGGSLHYLQIGSPAIEASAAGLDAHILLSDVLRSNNLLDIKHSIAEWRIDSLRLVADGTEINAVDYYFMGNGQRSEAKDVRMRGRVGWFVASHDLVWNRPDWDSLLRRAAICIDTLRVAKLEGQWTRKDGTLSLSGDSLLLTGMRGAGTSLTWSGVGGVFHDIRWLDVGRNVSVGKLEVDSGANLRASGVKATWLVRGGRLDIVAPLIRLQLPPKVDLMAGQMFASMMVPGSKIHFALAEKDNTIEVKCDLSLRATLQLLKRPDLLLLDCSWNDMQIDVRKAANRFHFSDIRGRVHGTALGGGRL